MKLDLTFVMSHIPSMEGITIIDITKYWGFFGVLWNEAKVNSSKALQTLPIVCIHSNIQTE